MSAQSIGEMEKDYSPNLTQLFLDNPDRRSRNTGIRELITVFHNSHRKDRSFLPAVTCMGAL